MNTKFTTEASSLIYLAFNPHALMHGSPHFLFIHASEFGQSELTRHSGRQFGGTEIKNKA